MLIERQILPELYGRDGHLPILFVDHITDGTFKSALYTFQKRKNKVSSTAIISREGRIVQLCELWHRPQTNGNIRSPKSSIVKDMGGLNPNYYSITIENEGYDGHGVNGDITEAQFIANLYFKKWAQTEVQKLYGHKIPLNSTHCIGHYQVDSVQKCNCPGPKFPWTRMYQELAIADSMTLEAYTEHLTYLQSGNGISNAAYALFNRFDALEARMREPQNVVEAKRKIMLVASVMEPYGLADHTPESVLMIVKELRKNAIQNGQWVKSELEKLGPLIQEAKNVGLIA